MKLITRRLIRPEHLNHHGTLYGGRISEWVTEAAFIAVADVLGYTEQVVIVAMKELTVKKPAKAGEIIQFSYELVKVGTTSIEIEITGMDFLHPENEHIRATAVFVTVDKEGKKRPHHLSKEELA